MLSIIIPAYNRVVPLHRCLTTVLGEYYPDLEIIVTDDCSTDGTAAYLQRMAARHSCIRVISNPVNKGVNFSRNRGIEMATQPFLLFLDSDDELAPGSLEQVKKTILSEPSAKHFLFTVSDRAQEFSGMKETKKIAYADWVSGRTSGDFTHVVKADIMKAHLFFEQFRTFEHLNWLRVKKETAPQLMVPILVANRERGREDSLAGSMKLKTVEAMRLKFKAEVMYYSLYYQDLKLYNPASLTKQLLQAVLLGAACKERSGCRSLIRYAPDAIIKLMANLLLILPPGFLQYSVIKYSRFRER